MSKISEMIRAAIPTQELVQQTLKETSTSVFQDKLSIEKAIAKVTNVGLTTDDLYAAVKRLEDRAELIRKRDEQKKLQEGFTEVNSTLLKLQQEHSDAYKKAIMDVEDRYAAKIASAQQRVDEAVRAGTEWIHIERQLLNDADPELLRTFNAHERQQEQLRQEQKELADRLGVARYNYNISSQSTGDVREEPLPNLGSLRDTVKELEAASAANMKALMNAHEAAAMARQAAIEG